MPPFARLGVLRGEAAFADTMHGLYAHTKCAEGCPGLYDTGSGLWYRDARFLGGGITSPNGLPVLWSRGNGWVAAAHVKVLGAPPATHRDAPEYRRMLTAGLTALRKVQRTDGTSTSPTPPTCRAPRPAVHSATRTVRPASWSLVMR